MQILKGKTQSYGLGSLTKIFYLLIIFMIVCSGKVPVGSAAVITISSKKPPYPSSPVIESISWDFASLKRAAPGSDLWPLTWASDDNLYTVWGDGGGFGGTDTVGRVSIGVARILGFGNNWSGVNVFGGANPESTATFIGKTNGIISIGGVLYMIVEEQDKWNRAKIGRSTDFGKTWTFNGGNFINSGWDFAEPGGAFSSACFLQFGKDYGGSRDNFVYGYSEKIVPDVIQPDIVMFRVPKDKIMNRSAYEFFAGLDAKGNPQWTLDINQMKPVFSDPNGVSWGMQAVYHPILKRYLLTVQRDSTGAWGIFDAPEPWGPWTTVAYYDTWIDTSIKFLFAFNQKWISVDGKTMYMAFSGLDIYDSFNVIKATLNLKAVSDTIPPAAPAGLITK